MTEKIQIRRGLSTDASSVNPILDDGEPGYETDTKRLKIGDGVTPWNSLPYFVEESELNDVSEVMRNGEAIPRRKSATSTIVLTSGQITFIYWRAKVKQSAIKVLSATDSPNASGLTYAAIGIYSVDESTDDLTKIADTGNLHSTLWTTTYTLYTSTISAAIESGQKYAVGFLGVGTTLPNVYSSDSLWTYNYQLPYLAATLNGQSSLPNNISHSAVSPASKGPAVVLLKV